MKLQYNDAQHAYWLDGARCKSITNVAKIPEDTFRLEQWSQRQVAIGLAIKPALLEQISANVDNNSKINALCEQAQAEAGAHQGRDRGNVLHTALEMHDTGKRFIPTDLTSTAIVGWEHILDAMGWTVELVERCVVWPEQLIAGRFDRIVKDRMGRRFIVDFKGGAKVVNYPHAIACQLALYANAPLLAGPIPGEGGFTEEFEKTPASISPIRAYVVHLPPDDDAQLIEIDIGRANEIIHDVIFPTIKWRAAKGLARIVELPEVTNGGTDTTSDESPGSDQSESERDYDPFDVAGAVSRVPHDERRDGPTDRAAVGARQANIAQRLTFLKKNHTEMAQVVAGRWPEGVPNIKMPLTAEDLDRIEAVLIDAERAVEAPFDPPPVLVATDEDVRVGLQAALDELGMTFEELASQHAEGKFVNDLARRTWLAYGPIAQGVQPHEALRPASGSPPADPPAPLLPPGTYEVEARTPEEGPDMAKDDIEAFKGAFAALDKEQQIRIDTWAAQAHNAGRSISMRDRPSKRRFSIGRFLLIASHHHEDVVRAVLGLTLGDEIQTTITTGSVLGVLTQAEAEKAWEIILGVDGGAWEYREGKLVAA